MDLSTLKNKIRQNKILYTVALIPYLPVKVYHIAQSRSLDRKVLAENEAKLDALSVGESDILYFGVPRHLNAGDMAQTYCTRRWLAENYPGSAVHEFNTAALLDAAFLDRLHGKSHAANIIFLQSGYTTQDRHPDHAMHKLVVQAFPDNKVVFLPQTVNIRSDEEMARTAEIYRNHSHLLFLVRDSMSYDMVSAPFSGMNVEKYPDIVTSLIGSGLGRSGEDRDGILLCLRNDDEKLYSTSSVMQQAKALESLGGKIEVTDTTLDIDYDRLHDDFEEVLAGILERYGHARIVITDRYHGTIFSAVADTPVVVLSTNDHKVKGGVEWFTDNGYRSVHYANSVEEAVAKARQVLKDREPVANGDHFKRSYYDRLKSRIDSL